MNAAMADIEAIREEALTPQRSAAPAEHGTDALVTACAGSGKSRIVAYRIASLTSQGANPKSIVAFTFTKRAPESIQQRVATALGRIGRPRTAVGKGRIGTIHSLSEPLLLQIDVPYRQFDVRDQNGLNFFIYVALRRVGHSRTPEPAGRLFRASRGTRERDH